MSRRSTPPVKYLHICTTHDMHPYNCGKTCIHCMNSPDTLAARIADEIVLALRYKHLAFTLPSEYDRARASVLEILNEMLSKS